MAPGDGFLVPVDSQLDATCLVDDLSYASSAGGMIIKHRPYSQGDLP